MTAPSHSAAETEPQIASNPISSHPELVRFLLLAVSWVIAISAALAPIVYLLRRVGVG